MIVVKLKASYTDNLTADVILIVVDRPGMGEFSLVVESENTLTRLRNDVRIIIYRQDPRKCGARSWLAPITYMKDWA